MNFEKLINSRYSVRGYKSDPVEEVKLEKVLQAARLAPSATNRQPYRLLVIKTEGREAELSRIYSSEWFIQAPYIICACGIESQAWKRQSDEKNYCMADVAIAFDHLILAATELGLGTCWIAAFDVQAAREVLALPLEYTPLFLTPLGYPNTQAHPKRRLPLSELVEYR